MKRLIVAMLVAAVAVAGCTAPPPEPSPAPTSEPPGEAAPLPTDASEPTLTPKPNPTPVPTTEPSKVEVVKVRIDLSPYYEVSTVVDIAGEALIVYFRLTDLKPDDPIQFFKDATREVLGAYDRLAVDDGVMFFETDSESGLACVVVTDDMGVICLPIGG